jgi:uncharacterized protein YjgD (DUF1641 family)
MSTILMDTVVAPVAKDDQLAEISRKLDLLAQSMMVMGQQVNFLMEQADVGRRRQQEWDDFMADLTPVVKEVYGLAEEQLDEMQQFVQLEDLAFLAKRLARNTRNINEMLDLLESGFDFVKDAAPLTRDMMDEATTKLEEFERKGYFGFVRQGTYVMDQIVTSFSEDDVKQLGDNVVLILNTVKTLTQPEMMNMVNSLTQGFHEAEAEAESGKLPTGMYGLLKQMNDPEVRRGLAITMATLKKVSQQAPRRAATNGKSL